MFHAGLAGDHPLARVGPLAVAAGAFLDAARVMTSTGESPNRWFLDGGVGLRIGIAEGQLGVLRLDLATALSGDRRSALTIGIHPNWPRFGRDP